MHFAKQGVDPNNDYLCSLSLPFRDGRETTSSINEYHTLQAPVKAHFKPTKTETQQDPIPEIIHVPSELP